MVTTRKKPRREPWRLSRFLRAHWRLLIAALFGIATVAVLPAKLLQITRWLIGWDIGVALYLVLVLAMILGSDADRVRRESAIQDEGRYAIPVLTVIAGLASLAGIIAWLRLTSASDADPMHLALLFLTTMLSWLFIHSIFALHYAHEYYSGRSGKGGGMRFPGDGEPNYWDFIYVAFAIGTTTRVSDVAVISPGIRRIVTAHGLVAFIFNVTLIALTVSIAGDAIRGR